MEMLWCWRCKQEVPMLDEKEYATIYKLYGECFKRAHKRENGTIAECFIPVSQEYERMTGMKEAFPNAIMHHRISTYGPPCRRCGKPLRTPRARFCAACGER